MSKRVQIFNYLDYTQAQAYVRSLGIKSKNDYRSTRRANKLLVDVLPCEPEKYYKEWEGWRKFLVKDKLSYESARQIVSALDIKSRRSYMALWKKDSYIQEVLPSCPRKYYSEWRGWEEYLNLENIVVSYDEFYQFISNNNIDSKLKLNEHYFTYNNLLLKDGKCLPYDPEQYYWVKSKVTLCESFSRIEESVHVKHLTSSQDNDEVKRVSLEDFIIFLKVNRITKRKDYFEFIVKAHKSDKHLEFPKNPGLFYENFPKWKDI